MEMKKVKIEGIYFVSEEYGGKTHAVLCELALKAGVRVVQYREKNKPSRVQLEEAKEICRLAKKYGATFIVNDRVDIAILSGADGVHVGSEDVSVEDIRKAFGEKLIVGVSVKTTEEALNARKAGADYVAVSPVFETATKSDAGRGLGISVLKEIASRVDLPVVAIGGINKDNIIEVLEAGASSAAVVSAISRAFDPYEAARELVEIYEKFKEREK